MDLREELNRSHWSLAAEIEARDRLGNICRSMFKLQRLISSQSSIDCRIKNLKEYIQEDWDNYIDGSIIFEEKEEFFAVRKCLEKLNIIKK